MNRSVVNVAASIVGYAISLGIGLAYTPFLVNSLGATAYGLVPLAFTLVQYMGFLTQTVSATIGQRLTANRDDSCIYNSIFSTGLITCAGLAVVVLLIGGLLAVFATFTLQIPAGLEVEMRWLIVASVAAFAIGLLSTPFNGTLFSQHLLFVNSIVKSLESIVRVLIVVALFLIVAPSLAYVSFGIVNAAIVGAILLVLAARWIRPSLRFSLGAVNKSMIRSMAKTAGGVSIAQVGTVLLFNSELLLMNLIYGPERVGAYAATMQWAVVLRALGLSVASNATARVINSFHHDDREALIDVTARYMRFLAAFMALPAGYIAGIAPDLLSVWLNPGFAKDAPILVVLAIPLAINLASVPLGGIMLAADKTYHSGWCYMITAIAFVVLAPRAAALLQWGGFEIALLLGLVLLAKNWIFMVPYAARLAGPGAMRPFLLASLLPILWVAVSFIAASTLTSIAAPQSFLELGIIGLLTAAPYAAVVAMSLPRGDINLLRREGTKLIALVRHRRKSSGPSLP